jgi:hypothetical protein
MDKLMELLKFFHGNNLNLKDDVYYLFMKDAVVSVYYDEDERKIKVDIEMVNGEKTFVYFSEKSVADIIA